jgi:signal peptidase II
VVTVPNVRRGWAAVAVAAIAVAAFTLDQVTKAWALSALSNGEIIQLVPTVRLELIFNPGVAFGIGADVGAPLVVGLMLVITALIAWICIRLVRGDRLAGTIFLATAAGGAVGNIWDRISRAENGPLTGHVVDFIAVDWFAIFNVADIFTTCGIAAWALSSVIRGRSKPEQHEGPTPQLR